MPIPKVVCRAILRGGMQGYAQGAVQGVPRGNVQEPQRQKKNGFRVKPWMIILLSSVAIALMGVILFLCYKIGESKNVDPDLRHEWWTTLDDFRKKEDIAEEYVYYRVVTDKDHRVDGIKEIPILDDEVLYGFDGTDEMLCEIRYQVADISDSEAISILESRYGKDHDVYEDIYGNQITMWWGEDTVVMYAEYPGDLSSVYYYPKDYVMYEIQGYFTLDE